MFEEELKELGIEDADLLGKLGKFVQSQTDKVRTEKSTEIKGLQAEVEKYKPREKTQQEIEFEATANELKALKFQLSLKDKGIDTELASFLKDDVDIDAFHAILSKGADTTTKSTYVPKGHNKDLGIDKATFQKMGYAEKAKLYSENPELYAQLSK